MAVGLLTVLLERFNFHLLMGFLFGIFTEKKTIFVVPGMHFIAIMAFDGNVPVNMLAQLFKIGKYVIGLYKIARCRAFNIYHWHSKQGYSGIKLIEIY